MRVVGPGMHRKCLIVLFIALSSTALKNVNGVVDSAENFYRRRRQRLHFFIDSAKNYKMTIKIFEFLA
jgi:hypothetical protein